ncbi:MAG: glycosyltransferase [Chloroflexi bacterium]|nr:glycosyltransferase [Chloroflexota bacterium]
MRVLIVSNLYPDARQPAFGTFVAAHADALRRAGADVAVVAISGVRVHRAQVRKYLSLAVRAVWAGLAARVRHARPQVVEAHVAYPTAIIGLLAARLAGAPLVVYCHGTDVMGLALRSSSHHAIAMWLLKRAQLVVANSIFTRDLLESRYGIKPARLIVLSPGVDLGLFSGPDLGRYPREILYVGWLSSQKGVYELMQATADLGDAQVRLRFVGGGPERAGLEKAAAMAGVRAEFTGPLPHLEAAQRMRQAAVIAMPSIHPEGLGLAALEAMAAGAMTVASAAGAIGELVEDGETGWLVEPGNVAALTAALRDALGVASAVDPARRELLRKRGMAKALEHDIDAIARRTLTVYQSLGGH